MAEVSFRAGTLSCESNTYSWTQFCELALDLDKNINNCSVCHRPKIKCSGSCKGTICVSGVVQCDMAAVKQVVSDFCIDCGYPRLASDHYKWGSVSKALNEAGTHAKRASRNGCCCICEQKGRATKEIEIKLLSVAKDRMIPPGGGELWFESRSSFWDDRLRAEVPPVKHVATIVMMRQTNFLDWCGRRRPLRVCLNEQVQSLRDLKGRFQDAGLPVGMFTERAFISPSVLGLFGLASKRPDPTSVSLSSTHALLKQKDAAADIDREALVEQLSSEIWNQGAGKTGWGLNAVRQRFQGLRLTAVNTATLWGLGAHECVVNEEDVGDVRLPIEYDPCFEHLLHGLWPKEASVDVENLDGHSLQATMDAPGEATDALKNRRVKRITVYMPLTKQFSDMFDINVTVFRQPALWEGSSLRVKLRVASGLPLKNCIGVDPSIVKPLNLDFDGDALTVVFSAPEAKVRLPVAGSLLDIGGCANACALSLTGAALRGYNALASVNVQATTAALASVGIRVEATSSGLELVEKLLFDGHPNLFHGFTFGSAVKKGRVQSFPVVDRMRGNVFQAMHAHVVAFCGHPGDAVLESVRRLSLACRAVAAAVDVPLAPAHLRFCSLLSQRDEEASRISSQLARGACVFGTPNSPKELEDAIGFSGCAAVGFVQHGALKVDSVASFLMRFNGRFDETQSEKHLQECGDCRKNAKVGKRDNIPRNGFNMKILNRASAEARGSADGFVFLPAAVAGERPVALGRINSWLYSRPIRVSWSEILLRPDGKAFRDLCTFYPALALSRQEEIFLPGREAVGSEFELRARSPIPAEELLDAVEPSGDEGQLYLHRPATLFESASFASRGYSAKHAEVARRAADVSRASVDGEKCSMHCFLAMQEAQMQDSIDASKNKGSQFASSGVCFPENLQMLRYIPVLQKPDSSQVSQQRTSRAFKAEPVPVSVAIQTLIAQHSDALGDKQILFLQKPYDTSGLDKFCLDKNTCPFVSQFGSWHFTAVMTVEKRLAGASVYQPDNLGEAVVELSGRWALFLYKKQKCEAGTGPASPRDLQESFRFMMDLAELTDGSAEVAKKITTSLLSEKLKQIQETKKEVAVFVLNGEASEAGSDTHGDFSLIDCDAPFRAIAGAIEVYLQSLLTPSGNAVCPQRASLALCVCDPYHLQQQLESAGCDFDVDTGAVCASKVHSDTRITLLTSNSATAIATRLLLRPDATGWIFPWQPLGESQAQPGVEWTEAGSIRVGGVGPLAKGGGSVFAEYAGEQTRFRVDSSWVFEFSDEKNSHGFADEARKLLQTDSGEARAKAAMDCLRRGLIPLAHDLNYRCLLFEGKLRAPKHKQLGSAFKALAYVMRTTSVRASGQILGLPGFLADTALALRTQKAEGFDPAVFASAIIGVRAAHTRQHTHSNPFSSMVCEIPKGSGGAKYTVRPGTKLVLQHQETFAHLLQRTAPLPPGWQAVDTPAEFEMSRCELAALVGELVDRCGITVNRAIEELRTTGKNVKLTRLEGECVVSVPLDFRNEQTVRCEV